MKKKHRNIPYTQITEDDIISQPERESQELLQALEASDPETQDFYQQLAEAEDPLRYQEEVNARLRSYRRASANIAKAYQSVLSTRDEMSARWQDLNKPRRFKLIPRAPANSVIDLEEQRGNHFAAGMNIYKMLLVCYIGCFAGVVVELLWCLLTRGYLESRSGLVYGPFNMLYGAGAVVLTAALYRFRNKGKWISFLGGFLVGSVLEYVCSWGQEMLFGSVSWDYSHMPFNLNGRICLLYSIFWGFLGLFWVKSIYPVMAKLILKIPDRVGKVLTWALTVFFAFNFIVTVLAVFRWSQRVDMIAPSNEFWAFIDAWFPDERMEKIFANMVFN